MFVWSLGDRGGSDLRNRHAADGLRMTVFASLLAALTGALSFVAIPLPGSFVPLTGQTFGVMLSGLVLGPLWGAASMAVYLALGCLGFPIFAGGGSGFGTLMGPSGGYLAGFVLGAWVTGLIVRVGEAASGRGIMDAAHRRLRLPFWLYLVSALVGGVAVVHLCGSFRLALYAGRRLSEAFALGSAPFLPGDVAKAVAAAAVVGRLRRAGV